MRHARVVTETRDVCDGMLVCRVEVRILSYTEKWINYLKLNVPEEVKEYIEEPFIAPELHEAQMS